MEASGLTQPTHPGRRTKRAAGWRAFLIVALVSFLLGGLTLAYLARQTGLDLGALPSSDAMPAADPAATDTAPLAGTTSTADTPAPEAVATASRAAREVARVAEAQGGLDQRIAGLEQRIGRLDLQSQAAAGNAARAEGLLISFATRRAIERGAPLGYLADQLRLRFGDAMPNAVDTVLGFAAKPVTLDALVARLQGLGPQLAAQPEGQGLFERIWHELGSLVVIRRETAPSPQPRRRLERARLFLESGRVDAAIAEVENMPGASDAQGWIGDARRYAAVRQALDRIETAAVLEPRLLRNGAGFQVEQPSPAGPNATAAPR